MKTHKFFIAALLTVAGAISLNADSSVAALEKRIADLEKKVAKLEKNTLYVSQGKLFADLQEEATSLQQKMMAEFQKKKTEIEKQLKALEAKKKDSNNPKAVDEEMAKLQQQFAQEMQKMQNEGKKQDDVLKEKADKIMADFVKEAQDRGYTNVQLLETLLPSKNAHPHESIVDEIMGSMKKVAKTIKKDFEIVKEDIKNVARKI